MNTKPIKFSDTIPVFLAKVFDQVNTLDFRNAVSVEEPDGVSGDKSFTLNKIVQRGLARYRLTKSLLTGNAMVPDNSMILPPQAMVDAFMMSGNNWGYAVQAIDCGITFYSPNMLDTYLGMVEAVRDPLIVRISIELNGNKLPSSNVNSILNKVVNTTTVAGSANGYIDLSGPEMGAPTGQGITDKATLISRGVTVITN